ncbi:hypothetical protein [Dyadobacter diqingensis]|uniref:hypothetical protein n=1 Tax=Dyadobacter diqingensis TaxID=2938121 RepID=UPI0020C1B831|nr:hypothetical protein [Dyadobacter diqingensis]
MNIKYTIFKAIYSGLFAGGILLATSSVFAQVKIGTNPTTIDANNNLEVESSMAGNKVSVHKTTGKVTIADGSQGDGKVLTSDANGVATWANAPVPDSPVQLSAYFGSFYNPTTATVVKLNFTSVRFDKSTSLNLATDEVVIPKTGYYQVSGAITSYWQPTEQGIYVQAYVNNLPQNIVIQGNSPAYVGTSASGGALLKLNMGDVLDFRFSGSMVTSGPGGELTMSYISQ